MAIGWHKVGLPAVGESLERVAERAVAQWLSHRKSNIASGFGQIYRFLNEIASGDGLVSYDPGRRVFLVGTVRGDPAYVRCSATHHSCQYCGRVWENTTIEKKE